MVTSQDQPSLQRSPSNALSQEGGTQWDEWDDNTQEGTSQRVAESHKDGSSCQENVVLQLFHFYGIEEEVTAKLFDKRSYIPRSATAKADHSLSDHLLCSVTARSSNQGPCCEFYYNP